MKKISIIGASGSIGMQTIDVIKNNPDKYELVGYSIGYNLNKLEEIIEIFPDVKEICVADITKKEYLESKYPGYNFCFSESGLIKIATLNSDILITAVVGSIGLEPTVEAIKKGINIGLANKETLVMAGHIIMNLAKENNVKILPVDSEHSAIFQCLNGEKEEDISKIILTASGGSFRDKTREELKKVTKKEALNHPNWSMGSKITIDSATMFNKGLEIIEAHYLFDIDYEDIDVLIHKESIIHSMVEFKDSSVMAQLGTPDMRVPIQYAITYPKRLELKNSKKLDLAEISVLNFKKIDFKRYPAVKLAYEAGKIGHSMPTVLNAANEIAVEKFLNDEIEFLEIENIVKKAMEEHKIIKNPNINQLIKVDQEIRKNIKKA